MTDELTPDAEVGLSTEDLAARFTAWFRRCPPERFTEDDGYVFGGEKETL